MLNKKGEREKTSRSPKRNGYMSDNVQMYILVKDVRQFKEYEMFLFGVAFNEPIEVSISVEELNKRYYYDTIEMDGKYIIQQTGEYDLRP